MSKTHIIYKDVAPGADEDAAVSTNRAQPFSTLTLPFGVDHDPISTCELNAWGLNGTFDMVDGHQVAFWSTSQSGADCLFTAQPVITILFDNQYSSTGISFVFDENDWCDLVNVQWWQQSTLKADVDFTPNSPSYFCKQKVLSYDKIVITLKRTRLPHHFAKLDKIYFGVYRRFGMSELRQGHVSISNAVDLLSLELPVSTLDWRLDSEEDADYLFQFKQPVEVYNDNNLICAYYIDTSDRTGNLYDIHCFDAFGVLDESPFAGGVYTNKSAIELFTEIVGDDFELDITAPDVAVTGAILPGTRRTAAQQVLFRWGAVAATDGSTKIRVFLPEDSADPADLGTARTFPGVRVGTDSAVTAVNVTAHSYAQNANGDVTIGGVKYLDTRTVYTVVNPNATASDRANVKSITDATLVSPDAAQEVAQRVFAFYDRRDTVRPKIVWRGEKLGQRVSVPNGCGGTATGHLVKMEIRLSNTVVADSEVISQ